MMTPCSIFSPTGTGKAILFNSPHSGIHMPDDFLKQISLDPDLLRHSSDTLVDQLIKYTPRFGATVMINNYSRIYVDTNRSAREIDPDMFFLAGQEHEFEQSRKVKLGFGTISRKSYNGREIYAARMPACEITRRLERVYHPVHRTMRQILDSLHHRHGKYLLLDCHSMPSYRFLGHAIPRATQPDLIIGNCYGASCAADLTEQVAQYFTQQGLIVTFNNPYAGGFNTQHYGTPDQGRHALQLEFNRALYLNETAGKMNKGFTGLQEMLTGLSACLFSDQDCLFSD